MPELRTQSAGAKVIEKEYAEMEKLAESRGLKCGRVVSGNPAGEGERPGAEGRHRLRRQRPGAEGDNEERGSTAKLDLPHLASFIHSNFTLTPVVANTYSNSFNSSLPHIASPLGSHERTFAVRPSNATWQFLGPKHFAIP
jgi:hypothetical protein